MSNALIVIISTIGVQTLSIAIKKTSFFTVILYIFKFKQFVKNYNRKIILKPIPFKKDA